MDASHTPSASLAGYRSHLRNLASLYAHFDSGVNHAIEHAPAVYRSALHLLLDTAGRKYLPEELMSPLVERTVKHLQKDHLHEVQAEIDILAALLADLRLTIESYCSLPDRPSKDDFEDAEGYEAALDEYLTFKEELDSLVSFERALKEQRRLLTRVLYLWAVRAHRYLSPAAVNGRASRSFRASRRYLAAFRELVGPELRAAEADAEAPLVNVRDPLAPDLMLALVMQARRRIAVADGDESKEALWTRIAERAGDKGDAKAPGDKVRKALTKRFSPPLIRLPIAEKDPLDLTIAKLLIVVLTLDGLEPGWTNVSDAS